MSARISVRGGTAHAGYFRAQIAVEQGPAVIESLGVQYACVFAVRGAPSSASLQSAAIAGDGGRGRACLPNAEAVGDGARLGTLCCTPAEEVLTNTSVPECGRVVCEVRGRIPTRLPPSMRARFVRFLHVLLVAVRVRSLGRGGGASGADGEAGEEGEARGWVTRGFAVTLERRSSVVEWGDGEGSGRSEVPCEAGVPLPPLWARASRSGAACVLLSRLQWRVEAGEKVEAVDVSAATQGEREHADDARLVDVPVVEGVGGVEEWSGGVVDVAGTRGLCSGLVWPHASVRPPRRPVRSVTVVASDGKEACRLELARAAFCPGSTLSVAVRMLSSEADSVPVLHVALQLEMLEGLRRALDRQPLHSAPSKIDGRDEKKTSPPDASSTSSTASAPCPGLVRAMAEANPLVQWEGETRAEALVSALAEVGIPQATAHAWAREALHAAPTAPTAPTAPDAAWRPSSDWIQRTEDRPEDGEDDEYLAVRSHPVRTWVCPVTPALLLVPCHFDIPVDAVPTARLPLVDIAWRLRVAVVVARGRDPDGLPLTELVQLALPVFLVPPTISSPQGSDALLLDRLLSPLVVPRHVLPPHAPSSLPRLDPKATLLPPTPLL